MTLYYILTNDKVAIPCENVLAWAEWFEKSPLRRVAFEEVGEAKISTVFMGLDHSFQRGADPVLFETMVFLPDDFGQVARYRTWAEAAAGHERIASMLRREQLNAERVTLETVRRVLTAGADQA